MKIAEIAFRNVMNLLGLFLILFFLVLSGTQIYTLLYTTSFAYHLVHRSYFITLPIIIISLFLSFNVIFNYFMTVLVKPGYSSDMLKKNEKVYDLEVGENLL